MKTLSPIQSLPQVSCFNCDDLGGGYYKTHEEETKWFIGLLANGQANYACENCAPLLFNVTPLVV